MMRRLLLTSLAVVIAFAMFSTTAYAWGTDMSDYGFRKQITVTNNYAGGQVHVNFTVNYTLDTNALIAAEKMNETCNDLNVTYGENTPLQRNITGCGSTATLVEFLAQAPISASGTDSGYYVYYGKETAAVPTVDKKRVYLYYGDSFTGTTDFDVIRTGTWSASGGYLKLVAAGADQYIAAVNVSKWGGTGNYTVETYVNSSAGYFGVTPRVLDNADTNVVYAWYRDVTLGIQIADRIASAYHVINTTTLTAPTAGQFYKITANSFGSQSWMYMTNATGISAVQGVHGSLIPGGAAGVLAGAVNGNIYYYKYIVIKGFLPVAPTVSEGAEEVGGTGPQYSNPTVTPSSTVYPVSNFSFVITWEGAQNAWVRHNASGVLANYLMTNNTATNFSYVLNYTVAAGPIGYYFYANNTAAAENFTSLAAVTVNQSASGLALSSSAGWTVTEGDSTTITCSNSVGLTMSLTRNSIGITNPWTGTLSSGIYSFICTAAGAANYTPSTVSGTLTIASSGAGCTNSDTFAFTKNITINGTVAVNFRTLIDAGFVKTDLSDVAYDSAIANATKLINSSDAWILFINNTQGSSSMNIRFGNYFANLGLTNATEINGTLVSSVTNYSELSAYQVITFWEERTGANATLPPSAVKYLTIYCTGGTSTFVIGNSTGKLVSATTSTPTSMRATVVYAADDIYYRDYLVTNAIESRNVWLVDATTIQVLQNVFTVTDPSNTFGTGSILRIKKYIGDSLVTITELKLDVEQKAIVFLMSGHKYQVYVANGNAERSIGEVYADPTRLTKNLVLQSYDTMNTTIGNLSWSLNKTGTSIRFTYYDPTNLTNVLEFWVYNATNGSQLYYASSSNLGLGEFTYVVSAANASYKVTWKAHHQIYGNNTIGLSEVLGFGHDNPIFPLKTLIYAMGGNMYWFLMLLVVPIPMLFPRRYLGLGAFAMLAITALLWYWGIYTLTDSIWILGIGLFLAILIEMAERKKWRD